MRNAVTVPALAVAVATVIATTSIAWERNSSLTGPRDRISAEGSRGCEDRSCSGGLTIIGRDGSIVSREYSGSCADGRCSGAGATTGPQNLSSTRKGALSR